VAVLAAAGCQTADGHRWVLPWEKPVAKEEIAVPPLADARYSEPQTLPKSAMKTGLPTKPAEAPRPVPGGGMGAGPMAGRPGAYGGF
jgi:hypothetical protein